MTFVSSYPAGNFTDGLQAQWFLFQDERLLVRSNGDSAMIPVFGVEPPSGIEAASTQFLGTTGGVPCFAASVLPGAPIPGSGLTAEPMRPLFRLLPEEAYRIAARALHLVQWDRTSRFCGTCGSTTRMAETERAKICTVCGRLIFPRISPAVIVAVVKDDRILLAHSNRYPAGFHSVLAGFVEPGETLEGCVAREVKEEAGIDIDNIRYFRSQPWPFPDSLMVGFTAQYAGGELKVDGVEVDEAAWYPADALPQRIPEKLSVSRWLIDWFVQSRSREIPVTRQVPDRAAPWSGRPH